MTDAMGRMQKGEAHSATNADKSLYLWKTACT